MTVSRLFLQLVDEFDRLARMAVSERKKRHREYLRSEHWKKLRAAAVERDGGKCVGCQSPRRLQVHHTVYRDPLEEGKLEDVQTLCITCHRMTHGLSFWHPFDFKLRDFNQKLYQNLIPTMADELELVSLVEYEGQDFEVEAMFRHVAGMRIILTSTIRWASFLKKPPEVTRRLFTWSREKRLRLERQVAEGGSNLR